MRRTAAALALALLLPLPGLAGEVVVKPGETLSEIAERYGTSVERLMKLNGLRSPQDLWAGSRIQVPGASGVSGGRTGSAGSGNYTVKSGETLSEIAERYGTSVERLMQINGLRSPQDLWAGSRIQVPGAGGSSGRPTNSRPPVNRNAREHQVQPGETLSEIAERYTIPMDRLVALNGLRQPDDLQVGTTLKLRGSTARPITQPSRSASGQRAGSSRPSGNRPNTTTPATTRTTPSAPSPGNNTALGTAGTSSARPTASRPAATATTATARPTGTTSGTPAPTAGATGIRNSPVATATPAPAASSTTPTTRASTSTTTTTATARPARPATPDWRSYGPLQVDWANWQPMAGSYVAPSLNSDGQPLYLAVNCSARRLNATGQSGTWKTWDAPQSDFEEQLISDLCKAKGS
jgi:LysM repeat protein